MIKKFLAVVMVGAAALLSVPGTASAAQTTTTCHSVATNAANPVTVCTKVNYRLQNDGDGVYVEKVVSEVTSGCAQIKANKLDDVSFFIEKGPGTIIGATLPAITSCNPTDSTIGEAGIDTGLTNFQFQFTVSLKDRTDPARRDWRANHQCDMDGSWYSCSAAVNFF